MKKIYVTILYLICSTFLLFAELDFCGRTVLVVLEPGLSDFNRSLVDESFFGNFEKKSVENIFRITNEETINELTNIRNSRSDYQFRSIYLITLPTDDKIKVLEAVEELKRINGIEHAAPNYYIETSRVPNDPAFQDGYLWGLTDGEQHCIKAPGAWKFTTGSHNVKVGVIDSGIEYYHRDLANNVAGGLNFVPGQPSDNIDDEHEKSHGTHVAGIIGAVGNNGDGIVGVNWNVRLVTLKVHYETPPGLSSQFLSEAIIRAIHYATDTWATNRISILNGSFSEYGTPDGINCRDAISNYPGLFVWSAGNRNTNVDTFEDIESFSSLPNLISVGSINISGAKPSFSNFSSSGNHVHVYAPGVNIYSTLRNNRYGYADGTSMSAPFVTGVAALLLSVKPELTAQELKTIIINSADDITPTRKRLNATTALKTSVHDLEVLSLNGPDKTHVNQSVMFSVSVQNNGLPIHDTYTIELRNGSSVVLATTTGAAINTDGTATFNIPWTPTSSAVYNIRAHVVYEHDVNSANNYSNTIVFRAQTDEITVGLNDNIQTAINLVAENGVVILSSGTYTRTTQLSIHNKNITLRGANSYYPPTILRCHLDLLNVSNQTIIENIIFQPQDQITFYNIIQLSNATPTLSNLTFELSQFTVVAAISTISNIQFENDRVLEILNSTFNGARALFIHPNTEHTFSLIVNNCVFNNNYRLNTQGNAISFKGTHLEISNSTFSKNNSSIVNYTTYPQKIEIEVSNVNSLLTPKEININNNKFVSESSNKINSFSPEIIITGNSDYNLNMYRNIFVTENTTNASFPPFTKIDLQSTPNMSSGFVANLTNNTDYVIGNLFTYRFIYHHGELIAKNNVFTGVISTSYPYTVNKIYNSLFVTSNDAYPLNINTVIENVIFGDPLINEEDFRPIWNTDLKSPLINAGYVPNRVSWFTNPEYQDNDGTRIDIGAVPARNHGSYKQSFTRHDPTIQNRLPINWVSFPFIDSHYEGQPPTIRYLLHENDNNNLLIENPRIFAMQWNVAGNFQELGYNPNTGWINDDHVIDSRNGYKIGVAHIVSTSPEGFISSTSGPYEIITSGFRNGHPETPIGIPNMNLITVYPPDSGQLYREHWVGYFLEVAEDPLHALKDITQWLTEIKTRNWSYSRATINEDWNTPPGEPLINPGEMVSIKYAGNIVRNFEWKRNNDILPPEYYVHPEPIYFDFLEQPDYIPIYVHLPEEMIGEGKGEIGFLIDGEVYGAEVITDDPWVQINAYIIDMEFKDPEIEFLFKEYGTRSEPKTIDNYVINNNDSFYVVSILSDGKREEEENLQTFLEANHPNPFNPTTTIAYNIAETQHVKFQIFNIRGQLVTTLVDEVQNSGRHSVTWHGTDANGRDVGSGIYLYRIQTNTDSITKRMLLMK